MFLCKLVLVMTLNAVVQAQSVTFVSGLKPDSRPKMKKILSSPSIDPQGLHGISGKIPPTLAKAVLSQGAWYTPLTEPGMTGPYDIRNYHDKNDVKLAESYVDRQWDPIHFRPRISTATNQECLACHSEVLNHSVSADSQAGVKASQVLAWYQTLDTYQGSQENLHWRHMESDYAKRVTSFRCTTCHQGNDPREEAWIPPAAQGEVPAFTLRKAVNPKVCLMCHGQFPNPQIMNLPGPWVKVRDSMANNCLSCHQVFRTHRHQVNFLKAEAIEEEGKKSGDSCYGCHGGRAWYRIANPYPRHAWPGMAAEIPTWAKNRPTESDRRFLINYLEKKVK